MAKIVQLRDRNKLEFNSTEKEKQYPITIFDAVIYNDKKTLADVVLEKQNNLISLTPNELTVNESTINDVNSTIKVNGYKYNPDLNSISTGWKTSANGVNSHAEGCFTSADGDNSHAEGRDTIAEGKFAHAEGFNTYAKGSKSHAEGQGTKASSFSHAEGYGTEASGISSHAEGYNTKSGEYSHAEGNGTKALGGVSHAEGEFTTASGITSHTEGNGTIASGDYSHAEGKDTQAIGNNSHAEGKNNYSVTTKQFNIIESTNDIIKYTNKYNETFNIGDILNINDVFVKVINTTNNLNSINVELDKYINLNINLPKPIEIPVISIKLDIYNNYNIITDKNLEDSNRIYLYEDLIIHINDVYFDNNHYIYELSDLLDLFTTLYELVIDFKDNNDNKLILGEDILNSQGLFIASKWYYENDYSIIKYVKFPILDANSWLSLSQIYLYDDLECLLNSNIYIQNNTLKILPVGKILNFNDELGKKYINGKDVIKKIETFEIAYSEWYEENTNTKVYIRESVTEYKKWMNNTITIYSDTYLNNPINPISTVNKDSIVCEERSKEDLRLLAMQNIPDTGISVLNYSGAIGDNSHSEGSFTKALGESSHSEGKNTMALDIQTHAEGYCTIASGKFSHAEGSYKSQNNSLIVLENVGSALKVIDAKDYDKFYESGLYFINNELVKTVSIDYNFSSADNFNCITINFNKVLDLNLSYLSVQVPVKFAINNEYSGYKLVTSKNLLSPQSYYKCDGKTYYVKTVRQENNNFIYNIQHWYGERIESYKTKITSFKDNSDTSKIFNNGVDLVSGVSRWESNTGQYVYVLHSIYNEAQFKYQLNSYYQDESCTIKLGDIQQKTATSIEEATSQGIVTKTFIKLPVLNFNYITQASGESSHTEGGGSLNSGKYSHAEGSNNILASASSHSEGSSNTHSVNSYASHSEGKENTVNGLGAHAEGSENKTLNDNSHVEGYQTKTIGKASHAEGKRTISGCWKDNNGNIYYEKPQGQSTVFGDNAHAEGENTVAEQKNAHAEGEKTKAKGMRSHAEGLETTAIGDGSHAEGHKTIAGLEGGIKNDYSHAEGNETTAQGYASHSEGNGTTAEGNNSHAEGVSTKTIGTNSHTEGNNTIAYNCNEHVLGQYNTEELNPEVDRYTDLTKTAFVIGNGIPTTDPTTNTTTYHNSDAFRILRNGKVYIPGIGNYTGESNDLTGIQDVATAVSHLVSITYTELKTLRDTSKLIPGQWYRMTDYITTVNKELTDAKVVDTPHQFDLVILATDVNKLNENCFAVKHNGDLPDDKQLILCDTTSFKSKPGEFLQRFPSFDNRRQDPNYPEYKYAWGVINDVLDTDPSNFIYSKTEIIKINDRLYNDDKYIETVCTKTKIDTYFDSSNLNAWKINYTIDNDVTKYSWAQPKALKLSCFNDLFYRDPLNDGDFEGVHYYAYYNEATGTPNWCYATTLIEPLNNNNVFICSNTVTRSYVKISEAELVGTVSSEGDSVEAFYDGKGVIYRMIDEYGNDCSYDFKNILFKRDTKWFNEHKSWCESIFGTHTETVPDPDAMPNEDGTIPNKTIEVINIPTTDMWFYTFSWLDEQNNLLDASIVGNDGTLTSDTQAIYGVVDNKIKNSYYAIEFDSYQDKVKLILSNNIFISTAFLSSGYFYGYYGNILGLHSINNTFGGACSLNIFGNDCSSNTFGDDCRSNTFGDYCSLNIFGNNCDYNTFGNYCSLNTFGNNCDSNIFGNNCDSINLNTPEDNYKRLQYIKVTSGVSGTDSSNKLDLTDIPRGLEYQTTVAKKSKGKIVKYCEADLVP